MSIYDNLPKKVSLAGKTRKVEEDVYGVNEEYPGLIRPYELGVPMQDAITEINQDLTLKEDIANKATDFSVINDTKYPTTKAVDDTYETKTIVSGINNRVTSLETANMIKSYTYNPSTHVLTFTYFDNSTTSFDLPLESAIVGASYDNVTKDITFTLQSGATLVVPLDDLISGLASETWVTTYFIPKTAIKTAFSSTPLDTNVISEKLAKDSLNLKEDKANKAIDFSVLNDTKYPTTKAVNDVFARKTQEAWITPTLVNSWVNVSGYTANYMKDNIGRVYIRGRISSGSLGTVAFTLPAGYRPSQTSFFPITSNDAFGTCYVNTAGQVIISVGATTNVSINISFKAEA